ncbi:MAG: AMP-dependent synthetase/ligase, partial [Candidatus Aquicultor sp.]
MPKTAPKKHSFGLPSIGSVLPARILPSEDSEEITDLFTKEQLDMQTIPGKFLEVCSKYPDKLALQYKINHIFGYIPYKRLLNLVENFTLSLETLGVKKGDRVVIVSENRPEWVVVDLSVKSLGAILVPIHKTLTIEQIKEIINEVEPTLFVASNVATVLKLKEVKALSHRDLPIVFMDTTGDNEHVESDYIYDFISALQLLPHDDHFDTYKSRLQNVKASEVAAIIYTPAANGQYVGVQLTHSNQVRNVENINQYLRINENDRFLSVLPLSHAFENTAGYYLPLFSGATINYLSDLSDLTKVAQSFQPTVVMGVPRLYEKLSRGMKPAALTDGLTKLGGKLRFLVSGGAALKPEISIFYNSLGITILEGYGLTEAAPVISVNKPENYRIGTVGQPLPDVTVKLADDGEILVKGPSVSPGYFKNKEATEHAFANGWLKTGDIGEFDENGFLKITGKTKSTIVLSTGKNVS